MSLYQNARFGLETQSSGLRHAPVSLDDLLRPCELVLPALAARMICDPQFQILDSVVVAYPVLVMDALGLQERATDVTFHPQPMLLSPSAVRRLLRHVAVDVQLARSDRHALATAADVPDAMPNRSVHVETPAKAVQMRGAQAFSSAPRPIASGARTSFPRRHGHTLTLHLANVHV